MSDPHAPWFERWREGRINFHEGKPNAFLARHLGRLDGRRRVLVPLCGKAEDLAHLAAAGHAVIGIELVEDAVRAFFDEHGLAPAVAARGPLTAYTAGDIEILAGDFFAATAELVGPVDAVYDRAALIALPPDLRRRYAEHVRRLVPGARLLLITLEGPPEQLKGPPFSVPEAEVRTLYAGAAIELVDEAPDARSAAVTERAFVIEL